MGSAHIGSGEACHRRLRGRKGETTERKRCKYQIGNGSGFLWVLGKDLEKVLTPLPKRLRGKNKKKRKPKKNFNFCSCSRHSLRLAFFFLLAASESRDQGPQVEIGRGGGTFRSAQLGTQDSSMQRGGGVKGCKGEKGRVTTRGASSG